MSYYQNSCLVMFFIFSLIHPLTCDSRKQDMKLCETLFQCGNITAGYPFWGGNRQKHCGYSLLELQCDKSITSFIISSQEFHVLHLNQTSNSLTLARTDLLGPICNSSFTSTTLPPEIFELSPTYKSLTVFYFCFFQYYLHSSYKCPVRGYILVSENPEYRNSCSENFTVNVPRSFVADDKEEFNMTNFESVLRKGFEVKLKMDEIACQECSSSHGSCGFNKTSPLGPKCSPIHPPPPPTAENHHVLCSTPFSCGNQSGLLYPFWTPDRKVCGHPDFELDCSRGIAEISIFSVKFRILEANYDSGNIKLARSDYIGDNLCPQNPINAPFDENVLPFASTTDSLTIYYDCSPDLPQYDSPYVGDFDCGDRDYYYVSRNLSSPLLQTISPFLNNFKGSCRRNVSIPASRLALNTLESTSKTEDLKKALEGGFEVQLNQECSKCKSSGGACGCNQTQTSSEFVCYCIDKPYSHTCGSRSKGISTKAKIGSGAGVTLFLFLVLTLFLKILRKRKTSHDLGQQNHKALIPLKQYSYEQVKRITKSFAEVVGRGGFGTVYRGTLSDGRMVAVKVLKDSKGNNSEDFINEVSSMSQTSHVNIVTLLGFCSEGSKRVIIYEFMENGSLDQFISSKRSSNMDWRELYRIVLGIARGLEYLHHGCRTRIVHFDIKPQNVLLDDNFCPKVSDFGLAKLCEKKESILSLLDTRGTIGYIAPELFSRIYGRVSHKSDVYSYGMLVLEMIGATKKERDQQNSASNTSSMYFPEWIYKDLEKADTRRLIENGISSEEDALAKNMTLVGLWCIQPSPSDRPAMNRVVEMMEGNVSALEVPPRPVFQIPPMSFQDSSTLSEDT